MPKPHLGRGAAVRGMPIAGHSWSWSWPNHTREHRLAVASNHVVDFFDRHWSAVIQFSARHLFCSAHAATTQATATASATRQARGYRSSFFQAARKDRILLQSSLPKTSTLLTPRRFSSTAEAICSDSPPSKSSPTSISKTSLDYSPSRHDGHYSQQHQRHHRLRRQHSKTDQQSSTLDPSTLSHTPGSSSSTSISKPFAATAVNISDSRKTIIVKDEMGRLKITDTSSIEPVSDIYDDDFNDRNLRNVLTEASSSSSLSLPTRSDISKGPDHSTCTRFTGPSMLSSKSDMASEHDHTPTSPSPLPPSLKKPSGLTVTLEPTSSPSSLSLSPAQLSTLSQSSPSISATLPTVTKARSTTFHSDKSGPWHFPTTTGFLDQSASALGNVDQYGHLIPAEHVMSWTSTSDALSRFYASLNQLCSLSGADNNCLSANNDNKKATGATTRFILRSALVHYNFLSRLQSTFDTILIPRRDTRALFLLQGREPKTRANLKQLLRIAMDLVWLNEKERKKIKKHGVLFSSYRHNNNHAKPGFAPHLMSGDYHGLRVSEYTILMDWIGSVPPSPQEKKILYKPSSFASSTASSLDASSTNPPSSEQATAAAIPAAAKVTDTIAMTAVDRIWGIWQDFLLTGMKPDVVLYTALMDALLNAKDFERADQIWNHMHQVHQKNQDHEHHPNYNADRLKPIPQRQQQNHQEKCPNVVTPNTQTLSVLMQAHVLKRDPEGVAQIYKEIIRSSTAATASTDMDAIIASKDPLSAQRDDECQQHHLSRQTLPAEGLARHTNTVLLNQILKVLVDYGEASAAKEIYAEMRLSPSGSHSPSAQRVSITDNNYSDESGADNNDNGKYTHTTQNPSSVPSASALPFFRPALPLHHQTFMRRSNWIHQIHRQSGIRPDKATHNLMLQLARRTGDHELEKVVLQNMQSSE